MMPRRTYHISGLAVDANGRSKPDLLSNALAYLLVAIMAVGVATYSTTPTISSTMLVVAISISILIACIAFVYQPRRVLPLVSMLAMLVFFTLISHALVGYHDSDALVRYVASFAALFSLRLAPLSDHRLMLGIFGAFVILVAAAHAANSGLIVYAGTVRLFPFWNGVVSSSLLVAAATILMAFSSFGKVAKVLWTVLGVSLVIGYGVVTTLIVLAMFYGGLYFLRKGWNRRWLYVLGGTAILAGVLFRDGNSVEGARIESLGLGAVGSGRLDAWLGRFEAFVDRDLFTKAVGLGPYSDYRVSSLWSWEAKNAHSDLVTLLMEFGFLGLGVIVLGYLTMFRIADKVEQLVLVCIAFGFAASNAFLDRPVVAVAWGFVLYASSYQEGRRAGASVRCRAD